MHQSSAAGICSNCFLFALNAIPYKLFQKAEQKFWRQIREDYNNMSNIVSHLDQILSNIIILSYSLNLTFILIQLFNSLR